MKSHGAFFIFYARKQIVYNVFVDKDFFRDILYFVTFERTVFVFADAGR